MLDAFLSDLSATLVGHGWTVQGSIGPVGIQVVLAHDLLACDIVANPMTYDLAEAIQTIDRFLARSADYQSLKSRPEVIGQPRLLGRLKDLGRGSGERSTIAVCRMLGELGIISTEEAGWVETSIVRINASIPDAVRRRM